jgi:hypothetical protein
VWQTVTGREEKMGVVNGGGWLFMGSLAGSKEEPWWSTEGDREEDELADREWRDDFFSGWVFRIRFRLNLKLLKLTLSVPVVWSSL